MGLLHSLPVFCYSSGMAISSGRAFARRGPDPVTEELVAVLSRKTSFEFKPLFELVHENLRARNATGSNEEMLRLRVYEKLQHFVKNGLVKKTINKEVKKYRGLPALSATS